MKSFFRLFFSGALFLLVWLPGCKTRRDTGDLKNRESDTIYVPLGSTFDRQKTFRLPSGRELDLASYRLEKSAIQTLAREPFKSYSTKKLNEMKNPEHPWAQRPRLKELGLSDLEVVALGSFTSWSYLDFVAFLKGNEITHKSDRIDSSQMEALFLATVSGFNKLPKISSTVYFPKCLDLKTYLPLLSPGKLFSERSFTSASLNFNVARLSSAISCPHNRPDLGLMMFTVKDSLSGANIAIFDVDATVAEVLFMPEPNFRVVSFKQLPEEVGEVSPRFDIVLVEEK